MPNTNVDTHRLDCWTWGGWETDRHYRRGGRSGTIYFGNGEWLEDWRKRMVSRDTLRMAAESGITTIITYFYKGFGMRADSTEWPRLKEYVRMCHEEGLKVWGYVQGHSIYRETFFSEVPEAADWVARRYDGTEDIWTSAYYRLAPCLTAPGYLAYMLRVVEKGLTELDLDGIHLDNSYLKHCYCERCRGLFREFLNARTDLEKRTGLPNADFVEPPPLERKLDIIGDPLRILWMEFGTQNRLAFLRALNKRIKEIKPDAIFHTNPAFPKRPASKLFSALDPVREAGVCDVVCVENGNLPRVEGGTIFSQAEAYLFGDAAGYRVLNTAWQRGPYGSSPAATPAGFWTGLAEEFSYHAAMLGNNWLLRAAGDGDRMLADIPGWREAHAEAVRYFQTLHRDLRLGDRKQWSEIGILIDPDTMTHAAKTDIPVFRALTGHLLTRGIPVVFVLGDQPIPSCVKALLVCQQSCLSEAQLERIQAFAAKPDRIAWIAGESGRYDEWNVPRNESRWRAWRESSGFIVDEGQPLHWSEDSAASPYYFGPDAFRITPDAIDRIDGFLASVTDQISVRTERPPQVLVNTETTYDGRLLIHFRDQTSEGKPISGVRVHLGNPWSTAPSVVLHRPGQKDRRLADARSKGAGKRIFDLPEFEPYALVEASKGLPSRTTKVASRIASSITAGKRWA